MILSTPPFQIHSTLKNPTPYVHNILHQYLLSLINHKPRRMNNMSLCNLPNISQPYADVRYIMHHHNHKPVYFTLMPSHDCDDINLQMFCRYSCSCSFVTLFRCSVVRLKSKPRYTFCQHHMYRLRTYSISSSICPNVCCCILHPIPSVVVCLLFFLLLRGSVYYVNAPTGRLKPIWLLPRRFFATINSYIPQLLKFHRYFMVEGALVA